MQKSQRPGIFFAYLQDILLISSLINQKVDEGTGLPRDKPSVLLQAQLGFLRRVESELIQQQKEADDPLTNALKAVSNTGPILHDPAYKYI